MDLHLFVQRLSTLYAQAGNSNTVNFTSPVNSSLPPTMEANLPSVKQAIIASIDCLIALTYYSTITVTIQSTASNTLESDEQRLEFTLHVSSPTATNAQFEFIAKTLQQNGHIFACVERVQAVNSTLNISDITTTQNNFCLALNFTVGAQPNNNQENDTYSEEDDWLADDSPTTAIAPHLDMPDLTGKRILIVEDNAVNQQLSQALLEETGAQLDTANNGLAALDKLTHCPAFDIVLMDLQMPLMDGFEATTTIRENPIWRKLPILGLTASALGTDITACLAAGMNDHVAKPIKAETLFSTIMKWLPDTTSSNTPFPQVVVDFSSIHFIAPTRAALTLLLEEFASSFSEHTQLTRLNTEQALELCRKLNELDICLALPPLQHEVNQIIETNDTSNLALLEHLLQQLVQACKRELEKPAQSQGRSTHGIAIEGFDCDSAIARLANKPDRYSQVLNLFLKNNMETTSELKVSIACSDWKTAQRIAHSSKGLAATIGATSLHDIAAQLEQHLKNNQSVPEELQTKYIETFENTLTSIKNHLNIQ